MVIRRRLPVTGYRDLPVPNRLRQAVGTSSRLTLLLPGYGYTLDMPLFYYIENLCLDRGSDVLRMETAYSQHPVFVEATEADQAQWVVADARATWQAGLAQAEYASVLVVGKSLSTLAMAALLAETLPTSQTVRSVWLTPLLAQPAVRQTLHQLGAAAQVVIGDADPHYDADLLADLEGAGVNVVVVPGADHGLDIPGDVVGSVRLLPQIITAIRDFGFRQG